MSEWPAPELSGLQAANNAARLHLVAEPAHRPVLRRYERMAWAQCLDCDEWQYRVVGLMSSDAVDSEATEEAR